MLTPNVLWAQRSDYIWITVDVADCEDPEYDLQADTLSFSCKAAGKAYGFQIKLFKPVNKEESKYLQHRLVDFCLKKEVSEEWPRLSSDSKKLPWLKVDWSKWEDSDAEEETDAFDMSKMGGFGDFGSMQGLNGLGDFSQFQDNDSDDEEGEEDLRAVGEDDSDPSPKDDRALIEEVNQAS
jgi:prostaglandin-E synthase